MCEYMMSSFDQEATLDCCNKYPLHNVEKDITPKAAGL
jgi:hypothetical protein